MTEHHPITLTEKDIARFWAKVDRTGGPDICWPWKTGTDGCGYGCFWLEDNNKRAHRVAWLIMRGDDPRGLCVLHRCDNPPCCNPSHLFLGTTADNVADKCEKGRQPFGDRNGSRLHPERLVRGELHPSRIHPECLARGESNGMATLTTDDVRAIRSRRANGELLRVLADDYGVHHGTISAIARGKSWRHVL